MSSGLDDIARRVLVLVAFLGYMAAIYLALHIIVARLNKSPESRLLWFFSVLTRPLTRPIQALLPTGTPESWVRYVAFGACLVVWLGARLLLAGMGEMGR